MLELTLLGSGTSTGVPQVGCDCPVCRSTDLRNRRLRASALVRRLPAATDFPWHGPRPPGEFRCRRRSMRLMRPGAAPAFRPATDRATEPVAVVIDAGMDFREQMLREEVRRLDAVVFTHDHTDHIGGLDDIRPYCFYQDAPLPVYAHASVIATLRRRFDYIWNAAQTGGGLPRVTVQAVEGGFRAAGIAFTPLPVKHGILDILGYRVGDTGYVTDASAISEEAFDRLAGVRWLILGAVQKEPHATHFNVEQAVEAARRIGPETTYLTHMNHHLDYEALAAELPPDVRPAHDGLTLPVRESP